MKRGNRTSPPSKGIKRLTTPRDLEILKFLHRHSQARSNHITSYFGDIRADGLLHRLLELRAEEPKLLYCPDWQEEYGMMNRHFVYANNLEAFRILDDAGYLIPENEWVRRGSRRGRQFKHDLMVTDFSALLDVLLSVTDVVFHSWKKITKTDTLSFDVKLSFKDHISARTSITPDHFFSLKYPKGFACFAVEANNKVDLDRKDLKEPSIFKKFLGYLQIMEDFKVKELGMSQPLYLISQYNDAVKMAESMDILARIPMPDRFKRRFLFTFNPWFGHPMKSPTHLDPLFYRVGFEPFDIRIGGDADGKGKAQTDTRASRHP